MRCPRCWRFLRERRFLKNVTAKTVTRTVVVSGPDDLSKAVRQDFVIGLRERGLSLVSCNTYGKAITPFWRGFTPKGSLLKR